MISLSRDDWRRLAVIVKTLSSTEARTALAMLGLVRGRAGEPGELADAADGLASALERLGPTFVKMGQLLATRSDLLPVEVTERLGRLHNNVEPIPFDDIREQLASDLGGEPETVFQHFCIVPLAAASIAQVHSARLHSGEDVVVKVRRPDIEPLMKADLKLLIAAAQIIERRMPSLRRHQPVRVMNELNQALMEELDFRVEARNQEELRARPASFIIPTVHTQFTSKRVIVTSRIFGRMPDAALRMEAQALTQAIAPQAAQGLLEMMLIGGVFHADPHPGNVLVTSDGRLALLDYGAVGRLTDRRREQTLVVLGSLIDADARAVCDVLLEWAGRSEAPNAELERRVETFLLRYRAQSGRTLRLSEAINEFIAIARENHLTLPPDLVVLLKTFATAEGLARTLDPAIDIIDAIAPVVIRAFLARFEVKALAARSFRAFKEIDQVLNIAPLVL